jgi:hypothetical protein
MGDIEDVAGELNQAAEQIKETNSLIKLTLDASKYLGEFEKAADKFYSKGGLGQMFSSLGKQAKALQVHANDLADKASRLAIASVDAEQEDLFMNYRQIMIAIGDAASIIRAYDGIPAYAEERRRAVEAIDEAEFSVRMMLKRFAGLHGE